MPELPEVEITRRNLARWLVGHAITGVYLADPTSVRRRLSTSPGAAHPRAAEQASALIGQRTKGFFRRGKRLGWCFEGRGPGWMLHLGMTGKWVLHSGAEPPAHGRIGLQRADEAWIWFVDLRRFGCLVPEVTDLPRALCDGLGPDALDAALSGSELASLFGGRRPIKVALMDQRCLAGLGTIQAAEALWRAGIAPSTPCERVRADQWHRLARVLPAQLGANVAAQEGESITYLTEGGPNPFAVYARAGQPCLVCQSTIIKGRLGGRVDYHCPKCQPMGDDAVRVG